MIPRCLVISPFITTTFYLFHPHDWSCANYASTDYWLFQWLTTTTHRTAPVHRCCRIHLQCFAHWPLMMVMMMMMSPLITPNHGDGALPQHGQFVLWSLCCCCCAEHHLLLQTFSDQWWVHLAVNYSPLSLYPFLFLWPVIFPLQPFLLPLPLS